ncbi:MAG: hypothetical protein JWP87_5265 [Labilithrix sp.]|nr:hypothetical protein [Labilithrix sp.]
MRIGVLGAGVAAASVAAAIVVSCGDPYGGDDPGILLPDRDGDAPSEASPAVDGPAPDAARGDAGADGDGEAGDPCDRDNDHYRSGEGGCGGADCDDDDNRAHPEAGFRADPATTTTNGDWNCDTHADPMYPVNVSCGVPALGACAGVEGFSGAPGCGAAGAYVTCKMNGLSCIVGSTVQRVQRCR